MTALVSPVGVRSARRLAHTSRKTPQEARNRRSAGLFLRFAAGALGGIRTPNLLIRSQMLYPLSYERLVGPEWASQSLANGYLDAKSRR